MARVEDLRWVRLIDPIHIPKYLVEQLRRRDFSVEDFYRYHSINCLTPSKEEGISLNPLHHLYALVNDENEVKGFLYFSVSPLNKSIIVQNYSVDKDYWNKGVAVRWLSDFVKKFRNKAQLHKVYWLTNRPKSCERWGFKRSEDVLMEYGENEADGTATERQCESSGNSAAPEPRAAAVPEESAKPHG